MAKAKAAIKEFKASKNTEIEETFEKIHHGKEKSSLIMFRSWRSVDKHWEGKIRVGDTNI